MSAPYLIGRVIDPLYAVFIGAGAAAVRIRREEKEKGRTVAGSVEGLKKRVGLLFEGDEVGVGGKVVGGVR
ncbi:hypothetical protein B0A55_06259 [Friedmanniomyces simplex]|uniref:Non-classical export protein 1 n=1 Tax=Friedmanniomyces simplex TaxID=329884 RepID=A0A4U0X954_9PEZI|nr:hypothetical protein B0A55_06259 [Friedmanniomyces simplex]